MTRGFHGSSVFMPRPSFPRHTTSPTISGTRIPFLQYNRGMHAYFEHYVPYTTYET